MQSTPQQHNYLESKVLTATQPQLHLMLLEGAIRFGRQAHQAWNDPAAGLQADHLIDRMIDLAETLVQGVQSQEGEISERLEELYAYLFRELVAIRFNRDAEKLDRILHLLQYERETWQQACALCVQEYDATEAGAKEAGAKGAIPKNASNRSDTRHAPTLPATISSITADVPTGGLSLEA